MITNLNDFKGFLKESRINENNSPLVAEVLEDLNAHNFGVIDYSNKVDGSEYIVWLESIGVKYAVAFYINSEVDEKPYYRPATLNDPEEGSSGTMNLSLVKVEIIDEKTDQILWSSLNNNIDGNAFNDFFNNNEHQFYEILERYFFQDDSDGDGDDDDRRDDAREWGGIDDSKSNAITEESENEDSEETFENELDKILAIGRK